MPETSSTDGTTLHYETAGVGETVVFVGEAGYGAWQWGWQNDNLAGPFRTLVWDLRGTGHSETPAGPYAVDQLATDLEAVLAASETDRAHIVGAGLGGMVALQYAHEYNRARTLTLCGTAVGGSAVDETALRDLWAPPDNEVALRSSLAGAVSDAFRTQRQELIEQVCAWRADDDATETGFTAQVDAVCAFEAPPLYEIQLPALVFNGVADPVVPTDAGRSLAESLPLGEFEAVEGRHLCYVEHARAVTDRLFGFLDEHSLA